MKLHLVNWLPPFMPMSIKAEDGTERYRFEEASGFTWGLTDAKGSKLLSLYKEWDRAGLKPLRPCHGTLNGEKFTARWEAPFPPMIDCGNFGWKAEGDLLSREFVLMKQRQKAAVLKRHWLRPGQHYTLDVSDPADEMKALAVALCICLMRKKK